MDDDDDDALYRLTESLATATSDDEAYTTLTRARRCFLAARHRAQLEAALERAGYATPDSGAMQVLDTLVDDKEQTEEARYVPVNVRLHTVDPQKLREPHEVESGINYAVDLRKKQSRTAQILALNRFLANFLYGGSRLVYVNEATGMHRILLDDDMRTIRGALVSSSDFRLRDVEREWDSEYGSVLRALFARDTTSAPSSAQDVGFAEAYLVRVLRDADVIDEVDWRDVLKQAIETRRVTLTDAALSRAGTRADGETKFAPQRIVDLFYLLPETPTTDAERHTLKRLVTYMNSRSTTDERFRDALRDDGIDRAARRRILEAL